MLFFTAASVYSLVPGLVPDVFGGGARTPRHDLILWTTGVVVTVILLAAISVGMRTRIHLEKVLLHQIEARDESLRTHAETAQAMRTLSGEIAHELKNPLASVKGLAALVAKDLDGRSAERMEVLRREVDRMQAVLQDFLNFSRPLAPLAMEPVDLTTLCRDVAELHDGVAEAKGVGLEVQTQGEATLTCDTRKVKGILVNLVQNALDASPRGSTVTIEVDGGDGATLTIRVIDEGPGVLEEIAERVFEAGVTSKAEGSGLGLSVARLLARQHGGELSLADREGGGCVAALILPREPGEGASPTGEAP
jgi:signal transduction histidine kinase